MRTRSAIGSVARAARYTNELVVHMRNGLPVLSVPVLPLSRWDASLSVQRLAGFHSRYTTRLDVAECGEPVTFQVTTGDHEEVSILYCLKCGRVLGVFGLAQQSRR